MRLSYRPSREALLTVNAGGDDPTIYLVASLGGHLELLRAVAPGSDFATRHWLTSDGSGADSLRNLGETVTALPRLDRGSLSLKRVLSGAIAAVRERPKLVVTSGAGLAVPFTAVARLLGAKVVHLETMARVRSGSMTGRLLGRIASRQIVQWPELLAVYPRATLCRPALLEGSPETLEIHRKEDIVRAGTFVTVGSHDEPFDRLLLMVRAAHKRRILPTPIFIQRGVTAFDDEAEITTMPFLSPEEFRGRVRSASLVISHGGAGAVSTAVREGQRPIVVVRQKERSEHLDDHQSELAKKLSDLGVVILVDDALTSEQIAAAQAPRQQKLAFEGSPLPETLKKVCLELLQS